MCSSTCSSSAMYVDSSVTVRIMLSHGLIAWCLTRLQEGVGYSVTVVDDTSNQWV